MATNTSLKRLLIVYNLVVNLLWSILSLVPLCVFCYMWVENNLLFLFIGLCLLPAFLSRSAIDKLQISSKAITYKKIGVALILNISQNGVLINYLIRKKHPGYKAIRLESKSIERLLKQTYAFEKFHLIGFIFFSLIGLYAYSKNLVEWAFAITSINLFYNFYPIMLQQYIRLKLALYKRKGETKITTIKDGFTKFRQKCLG